MNEFEKFYRRGKIFYIFVICLLCAIVIPASVCNIIDKKYGLVCLGILSMVLIMTIATIVLLYFRGIVVEVAFKDNGTIIKTNGKVFVLPTENFVEVNDSNARGRIYIIYADEKGKKKFVFLKKYSPFKAHSLDIIEMKKHMTSAKFNNS